MINKIAFYGLFFPLIAFMAQAETINIHGKAANKAGQPISGAIITLLRQALKDTTGADGSYAITKPVVAVLPPLLPRTERMSLRNGVLELSLNNPSPVKVEVFNVKGDLLKRKFSPSAAAGVYRLNISEISGAANLLAVHARIGDHEATFRCLPLGSGMHEAIAAGESFVTVDRGLVKMAAAVDSLQAVADGYMTQVVTISSYDKEVNFVLDSAHGAICLGCGKTDHPASGKATMTVDGTQREYTLLLPDNYEPNKQYKLIFCPHWLGGTMADVISGASCNGPYYGLKALANNTAIFVAPNGLKGSMGTGWENVNGKDIKFFKAMLGYFDSTLCIDQKRIFSVGFSYGGMMSFALGCSMWNVFRAIAPMSGAFYSGCDSSSKGSIAVWQAHGTSDNVVPPKDGKAARDYFLARNGCGSETTPVTPSPCVQFKGCKEGAPYIFCEFNGGHGVQTFAAQAVWDFFNQF